MQQYLDDGTRMERTGWRDDKPVFNRCLTVKPWAGLTVSEDGDRGARFRPYRGADAPHSGNSALRVLDCPEDEARLYGPSVREGY